jgi:hypothetical protein
MKAGSENSQPRLTAKHSSHALMTRVLLSGILINKLQFLDSSLMKMLLRIFC